MKRRYFLTSICSLIVTLTLVAGLKFFTPTTPTAIVAQSRTTLLISAAASLQDTLDAIAPLFEQANSNITVNHNFGSSGSLQQQIQQGAPADVFISAGVPQMDALQQANLLLQGTRRNLLTNRLVLIVPRNSHLNLTGFRQLTSPDVRRIAVGEFRSVPAGQYAEQFLTNLGMLGQVRSKLVFANTVRGVLAMVESGNADAGIVYTTDGQISDQVRQVATAPTNLHSPIVYPIAILRNSRNAEAARAYIQFLFGNQARDLFEQAGFGISR